MKFHHAEISDILRCSQRDESFVNELQEYVGDVFKLIWGGRYNAIRHYIPIIANSWYYLLTSVSNLQTLGEEYTGTIRISSDKGIPSTLVQIIWLIFYIGGDKLFDKFLTVLGKKTYFSESLTEEAKSVFISVIDFLKENKYIILRIHTSIFYIYGTYQNLAHRCTGLQYVLLRKWIQDTSATISFNILGKISLVYLMYLLGQKLLIHQKITTSPIKTGVNISSKMCVMCVENCKNISVTPCGHLFCWECIFDSLKYQSSCPVCREDIQPSRIVLLQNY